MDQEWLKSITDFLLAVTLSVFVAIIRVMVDGKEKRMVRVLLEGLLCGGITCAVVSLASWYGIDSKLFSFIGGFVGLVGSAYIRQLARKLLDKKTD